MSPSNAVCTIHCINALHSQEKISYYLKLSIVLVVCRGDLNELLDEEDIARHALYRGYEDRSQRLLLRHLTRLLIEPNTPTSARGEMGENGGQGERRRKEVNEEWEEGGGECT